MESAASFLWLYAVIMLTSAMGCMFVILHYSHTLRADQKRLTQAEDRLNTLAMTGFSSSDSIHREFWGKLGYSQGEPSEQSPFYRTLKRRMRLVGTPLESETFTFLEGVRLPAFVNLYIALLPILALLAGIWATRLAATSSTPIMAGGTAIGIGLFCSLMLTMARHDFKEQETRLLQNTAILWSEVIAPPLYAARSERAVIFAETRRLQEMQKGALEQWERVRREIEKSHTSQKESLKESQRVWAKQHSELVMQAEMRLNTHAEEIQNVVTRFMELHHASLQAMTLAHQTCVTLGASVETLQSTLKHLDTSVTHLEDTHQKVTTNLSTILETIEDTSQQMHTIQTQVTDTYQEVHRSLNTIRRSKEAP